MTNDHYTFESQKVHATTLLFLIYTAGKQVCKRQTDKLSGITETKQLCFRKPVKFQYKSMNPKA